MSRVSRFIKNPYVFSVGSKLVIVLLGFLFSVVQSRYLGAALKGDIAYVSSVTSITCIVFGFGIHQAYPYYKKRIDGDIRPFFLRLAFVELVVYCAIALIIAVLWHPNAKYMAILFITPLSVYNRVVSYLTMVESPNEKNATEMLVNFAELILVVFLWLTASASFLIALLLVVFKDAMLAAVYSYKWRKLFFEQCELGMGFVFTLFKFGFFPMLALLMSTLNYRVDIIMLNSLSTNVAVGVYSVGVSIAERVWLIPDALKDVMVSKLSKGKDSDEVTYVIRICNTACLFVVLGIVLLGKPFVNALFGTEYAGAYDVIVVMMLGVFAMIYYKMIASYNIVNGKQIVNFVLLGLSTLTNIVGNLVLIPKLGMMGAAWASVISYSVCAGSFVVYFCLKTGVKIQNMTFITRNDFIKLKSVLGKK